MKQDLKKYAFFTACSSCIDSYMVVALRSLRRTLQLRWNRMWKENADAYDD